MSLSSLPPYGDTELNTKVPFFNTVSESILEELKRGVNKENRERLISEINECLELMRSIRVRVHQVMSASRKQLHNLNERSLIEERQEIVDINQRLTKLTELQKKLLGISKEIRDKASLIGIDIL